MKDGSGMVPTTVWRKDWVVQWVAASENRRKIRNFRSVVRIFISLPEGTQRVLLNAPYWHDENYHKKLRVPRCAGVSELFIVECLITLREAYPFFFEVVSIGEGESISVGDPIG